MFARRASWTGEPSRWARAVERARAAGRIDCDLTISNPTAAGIAYPWRAIDEALAAGNTRRYTPAPLGLPEAREAVAQCYAERGVDVSPDQIAIVASTSEAYLLAFRLLCDGGEAVAQPRPGYPLITWLARIAGLRCVPWPLERLGVRWRYDLTALGRLGPGVRVVTAVAPNNPTGTTLCRADFHALCAWCAARDTALIVDEVFADYPLDAAAGPAHVPPAGDGLVLCLDGLSKARGLPHLKVGWVRFHGATPLVREAMRRWALLADCLLSVATPVQRALPRLLVAAAPVRDAIAERVRRNARALGAAFPAGALIEASEAPAGWYGVLRLPRVLDDEQWALVLLDEAGVLVQPGFLYDFDEEGLCVLSLLTPPEAFRRGIGRIRETVERYTMTSSI